MAKTTKARRKRLPAKPQPQKGPDWKTLNVIFSHICSGSHAIEACEIAGISKSLFYNWMHADAAGDAAYSGVMDAYARACKVRTDAHHEENFRTAELAAKSTYKDAQGETRIDHGAIHAAKLIIDTRKWSMARMNSGKYSGRDLEGDGDNELIIRNAPEDG